MSVIYCFSCDNYVDTDYDVEHEEECADEPQVGSYEHIKKVTEATTGKTQMELIQEMCQLSDEMGGLTDPVEALKETSLKV